MNKQTKYWLLYAITGLLLTGAGLCICIDAGLAKLQQQQWFWQGTIGLIVFNTGLCLAIRSNNFKG